MDLTDVITTLVPYLDGQVGAPIRVSGMEDERPVPLVLVEDWTITDHTWHNTQFAGQAVDPDDGAEKRWFRFYWSMRLDLLIRDDDDVDAHRLLDQTRKAISNLQRDPSLLHDHLIEVEPGGAGGINHQFIESKETELNQSLRVMAFHEVRDGNYDTIQEIILDFNYVD